jgi:hypothetical protein
MMKADSAAVSWDADKKTWRIRIQVGEEVIKRQAKDHKVPRDAGDDVLRNLAVETAQGDGYEVDREAVTITR